MHTSKLTCRAVNHRFKPEGEWTTIFVCSQHAILTAHSRFERMHCIVCSVYSWCFSSSPLVFAKHFITCGWKWTRNACGFRWDQAAATHNPRNPQQNQQNLTWTRKICQKAPTYTPVDRKSCHTLRTTSHVSAWQHCTFPQHDAQF